jgi:hypothetical protein
MSSADVFAQARGVREQATLVRGKAIALQQAIDHVRAAPGGAPNTLSAPTWAGAKASATKELMQGSFDVLRYAADQASGDVEELLGEARRLEGQADQLDIEAKRLAYLEAEAEAARQRAAAAAAYAAYAARVSAANAAAAASAHSAASKSTASSSPSASNTSSAAPAKPALIFAPIATTPAASSPALSPSISSSSSPEAASADVACSAF